jgi:PBP1b-binding outer membrane lipoprotein LpoB
MRRVLIVAAAAVLLAGCGMMQTNADQIQAAVNTQVNTAQTDLTAAAQTDLNGLKDMIVGNTAVVTALNSAVKEINTAGLNALQNVQNAIQARLIQAINMERDRAIAEINLVGGTASAAVPLVPVR